MRLTIITCGSAKLPHHAQARHLYTGSYFRAQLEWALATTPPSRIRILSAKHGILKLTDTIEPYDLRMGEPGSVTADQIAHQLPEDVEAITSAGQAYLQPLREAISIKGGKLEVPFNNVGGMGKKIQAMKRASRI